MKHTWPIAVLLLVYGVTVVAIIWHIAGMI